MLSFLAQSITAGYGLSNERKTNMSDDRQIWGDFRLSLSTATSKDPKYKPEPSEPWYTYDIWGNFDTTCKPVCKITRKTLHCESPEHGNFQMFLSKEPEYREAEISEMFLNTMGHRLEDYLEDLFGNTTFTFDRIAQKVDYKADDPEGWPVILHEIDLSQIISEKK